MSSNNAGAAGGGAIYGLGIFGAFVYYWQQADTFWEYVLSFIQGLFWPAWMVYVTSPPGVTFEPPSWWGAGSSPSPGRGSSGQ